jgi:hypothetical protein
MMGVDEREGWGCEVPRLDVCCDGSGSWESCEGGGSGERGRVDGGHCAVVLVSAGSMGVGRGGGKLTPPH